MDLKCKLVKKTFTADNGEIRSYYVLEFPIVDDETLDITIKKDKAQLLLLSNKIPNFPDNNFWSNDQN